MTLFGTYDLVTNVTDNDDSFTTYPLLGICPRFTSSVLQEMSLVYSMHQERSEFLECSIPSLHFLHISRQIGDRR